MEDRLQKSKIQNEIEIIRKEINLLEDRLTEKEIQNKMEQIRWETNILQDKPKKNKKYQNQFQNQFPNGLKQANKIQIKKEEINKARIFFKPKKCKI